MDLDSQTVSREDGQWYKEPFLLDAEKKFEKNKQNARKEEQHPEDKRNQTISAV